MEERGFVFDIQGYTVHDGPGCRTTVFLSGCPLRCTWCSNPEGQTMEPRLLFTGNKCTCSKSVCIPACPMHAIAAASRPKERIVIQRKQCLTACAQAPCVAACHWGALSLSSRSCSVQEIMKIVKRDQNFWGNNGGVTFSGGEPFFQKEFFLCLLKECRNAYIHTAVETSGIVETDRILASLALIDWLFIDIKHMDSSMHLKETGIDNTLCLANIAHIVHTGWQGRLVIRIPVIPGFNDTTDNMTATATFLKDLNIREVNILPFHRLGTSKYEKLGLDYKYKEQLPPAKDHMTLLKQPFESAGVHCYIDFETPF